MTKSEETGKPGRSRGFSLMELLAVMSIMGLLSTLAVTSYFGAVRGMARRSAISHVFNSLTLARQRACMEGSRVGVMFFNEFRGFAKDADGVPTATEINIPSYVVCKELGRFSYVNGDVIGDEFAELDKMFGTNDLSIIDGSYQGQMRLYNLTHGGWFDVRPWVLGASSSDPAKFTVEGGSALQTATNNSIAAALLPMYGYNFKVIPGGNHSGNTATGDAYGIEAAPVGALPKEFVFDTLASKDSDPIYIIFLPTGKPDTANGARVSVTIKEVRDKSHPLSLQITVHAGGDIEVDNKGIWK